MNAQAHTDTHGLVGSTSTPISWLRRISSNAASARIPCKSAPPFERVTTTEHERLYFRLCVESALRDTENQRKSSKTIKTVNNYLAAPVDNSALW